MGTWVFLPGLTENRSILLASSSREYVDFINVEKPGYFETDLPCLYVFSRKTLKLGAFSPFPPHLHHSGHWGRIYTMPKITEKGTDQKTREIHIAQGLKILEAGEKLAAASDATGIPPETLRRRAGGSQPRSKAHLEQFYFTESQGSALVAYALRRSDRTQPLSRRSFIMQAAKIASDHPPIKSWYQAFMKRHPELDSAHPHGLADSCASIQSSYHSKSFQQT